MFHYKTEFQKKIKHDIVTTKEDGIQQMKRFALGNEEFIVYKRQNRNWNFQNF